MAGIGIARMPMPFGSEKYLNYENNIAKFYNISNYFFMKISYPKRRSANVTTNKKKIRINLLPFVIANLAPNQEPVALQTAIGRAMVQIIFPFNTNSVMEPKLVARLTSFAIAEAFKKSNPRKAINAIMSKLPVPGPINPS